MPKIILKKRVWVSILSLIILMVFIGLALIGDKDKLTSRGDEQAGCNSGRGYRATWDDEASFPIDDELYQNAWLTINKNSGNYFTRIEYKAGQCKVVCDQTNGWMPGPRLDPYLSVDVDGVITTVTRIDVFGPESVGNTFTGGSVVETVSPLPDSEEDYSRQADFSLPLVNETRTSAETRNNPETGGPERYHVTHETVSIPAGDYSIGTYRYFKPMQHHTFIDGNATEYYYLGDLASSFKINYRNLSLVDPHPVCEKTSEERI